MQDERSNGLNLASRGVFYDDISTSPPYALRESLVYAHEEGLSETTIIGIVSLLFWTVMLILPQFEAWIVPLTLLIRVTLFAVQRTRTEAVAL